MRAAARQGRQNSPPCKRPLENFKTRHYFAVNEKKNKAKHRYKSLVYFCSNFKFFVTNLHIFDSQCRFLRRAPRTRARGARILLTMQNVYFLSQHRQLRQLREERYLNFELAEKRPFWISSCSYKIGRAFYGIDWWNIFSSAPKTNNSEYGRC